MKKRIIRVGILGVSMFLASCGISTKELTEQVKESIEQNWVKEGVNGMVINNLTLVKKVGNVYEGRLEVTKNDEILRYSVEVIADEDNMLWEIKN